MSIFKDRQFNLFLIKFLGIFACLYFGTLAVIGLSAPGKYYSPFIENYLDYVSWLKQSLIWGTKIIVGWFGYNTYQEPDFVLRTEWGAGIKIAMSCVGYGVYSFWAAYVIANKGTFLKKLKWTFGGLLFLWMINSFRIALVLLAEQKRKPMPWGIDHHTWFNIVAYAVIFGMIYFYEKKAVSRI